MEQPWATWDRQQVAPSVSQDCANASRNSCSTCFLWSWAYCSYDRCVKALSFSYMLDDGRALSWGYNQYGQLGLGNFVSQTSPQVVLLDNAGIASISCGGYHTMISLGIVLFNTLLKAPANGILLCCGLNDDGQLGIGTNVCQNIPVSVKLAEQVVSVKCGLRHTAAITGF